ncbi:MAG: AAA family ATPase [Bacillus sp. (in: Bacteria)]|nr:AAA family ATPase [Bacillus sp. (in: firmicutes)]MCM1427644.1 AAA family ATPase [Eubacterium sp.]
MISTIIEAIKALPKEEQLQLVAIEGRCAAGKTTLAEHLSKELNCPVIHMDHFFLRPEQRTKRRLSTPGGNVDYERFLMEVMAPLRMGMGKDFRYRPYDCQKKRWAKSIHIIPQDLVIVEGSYSCHPALWENYDLKIFLNVDKDKQLKRIEERGGKDALTAFREKWIPLEEMYFSACRIAEHCDMHFQV